MIIQDRVSLKKEFLDSLGIKIDNINDLPQDASKRSYSRVFTNKGTFILMDAPPLGEDIVPFIKVTNILRNIDLSAPEIYKYDIEKGYMLLEDFGDDSLNKHSESNPNAEIKLYSNAVSVLSKIYNECDTSLIDLKSYDYAVFEKEAMIFAEYCIFSTIEDKYKTEDLKYEYRYNVKQLYNLLTPMPKTMVLRDFHSDNIHVLGNRDNYKSMGIIDYQDALIGDVTYDIMSLLEDARRDVGPNAVKQCLEQFIIENNFDVEEFMHNYYIWALQRNLKIIGIFNRKLYRDGVVSYQKYLPRVWRYIFGDCNQPHLEFFRVYIEKLITVF